MMHWVQEVKVVKVLLVLDIIFPILSKDIGDTFEHHQVKFNVSQLLVRRALFFCQAAPIQPYLDKGEAFRASVPKQIQLFDLYGAQKLFFVSLLVIVVQIEGLIVQVVLVCFAWVQFGARNHLYWCSDIVVCLFIVP